MQTLTIGTRTSRLARWQTNRVAELLEQAWPGLRCEIQTFETKGDRTLDQPLPEIGGKGLFTAELERALAEEVIDIAVHSLKDLPVESAPGLTLGAITERADVHDGLVARKAWTLETLPEGAVVGTSSLRRQAQLLARRPDLTVKSIRGNVGTRVRKALEGDYHATVLAAAGLRRLGLADVATQWLPLRLMLPAPGQGALAVQCRAADGETLSLLRAIDSEPVRRATTAERLFLQALGGGCSAPIAAYAAPHSSGRLYMQALIATPDGRTVIRLRGEDDDPERMAGRLAEEARRRGAEIILAAVRERSGVQMTAAPRPLANKRVVVTRPPHQAPEMAARLRALGAVPVLFPTITITPVEDTTRLDRALASLESYDWIVFTSVNGVAIFFSQMDALGVASSAFHGVGVAAIGPATGDALRREGIEPDFIPEEFVAERIAEGLGDVQGLSFLLPRAAIARPTLREMLAEQGATVDEVPTYNTLPAEPDPQAIEALDHVEVLTFTSSSTVRNFVRLVGGAAAAREIAARAVIACIGPITAGTVEEEIGLSPAIVAEMYTINGLLEAIVQHFSRREERESSS